MDSTVSFHTKGLVRANMGTRFVQINVGGWDMHANIYGGGLNAANANALGRTFDAGLATLIADLKDEGLLERTLIFAMGEFGRTLGAVNACKWARPLSAAGGAGGRRGDSRGARARHDGRSRGADRRSGLVARTRYSRRGHRGDYLFPLGIDWTTVRRDDPSGRGFEYIPSA